MPKDKEPHPRELPPSKFAETNPPFTPSGDYTYVLETVMSMHNSMGKLEEAVATLKSNQTQQGQKLEGIDKKIYAAIAVMVVIGSILTFFANSINSALTNRVLSPPVQQQPQSSPTPVVTPTPKSR